MKLTEEYICVDGRHLGLYHHLIFLQNIYLKIELQKILSLKLNMHWEFNYIGLPNLLMTVANI